MPPAVEQFYADEPLFAVLNAARYRTANRTTRVVAEFFDTGEAYVANLLGFIRSHFDQHFTAENVLEFGCGPGRLAIPFARHVPRVVAVDASPAMLESARRFAGEFGAQNVELLSTEAFARSGERFDLVNCHLVLQRLSQREGLEIIRLLLSRLEGIGVFHLPYRDNSSVVAKMTRWLRVRSWAANRLANMLLRKPPLTALIRATVYNLNDLVEIFNQLGFESLQVTTAAHDQLETATFFVRRRKAAEPQAPTHPVRADDSSLFPSHIDIRQLVASTPLEEWNRRAEEYFAGLPNWQHHIAKPFNNPDETPGLLINFAVLLQGLRLTPGQAVLDFGAGTGWLSRYLTQLGCRAILVDVSATALRIAEETYRQIPLIGDRPAPTYLHFDGRRIELPDESVDRIVCFDAFHHAPNPEEILREFGRILRPGGIASFAEPGPTHSQTAQSQFEMRTYGVLENDIDLPHLWKTAQEAGFTDLRVAAFNIPPFQVSLAAFQDLLEGGRTYTHWADRTRDFLRHVRNFVLTKGDAAQPDSRRAEGLRAAITVEIPEEPSEGPLAFRATVANIGSAAWLPSTDEPGAVWLGCHLYDATGHLLNFELARFPISAAGVAPDQTVETAGVLPALPSGEHRLEFDCVADQVTWFSQVGSLTTMIQVRR